MSATVEYLRAAADHRGRAAAVYHAVPSGEPAAACGADPVGGWSCVSGDRVTCPACRRKLAMGPLPAPRTEGGAT